MEGHCSTGQSPQWAVVPMEEEEEHSEENPTHGNMYRTEKRLTAGKATQLLLNC